MTDQNDDIGHLFRTSFEGVATPVETGEWEMLRASLVKRNFFHFNAYQFNVYYAGCILFCFMTCLGVGGDYVYRHYVCRPDQLVLQHTTTTIAPAPVQQVATETNAGKGNASSTLYSGSAHQSTNRPGSFSSGLQTKEVPVTGVQVLHSDSVDLQTHSAAHASEASQLSQTDSVATPQKRTLYVTKQDTIIQYDTVQQAKRKKKWF